MSSILIHLFTVAVLIGTLFAAMVLIGTALFDINKVRKHRLQKKSPNSKFYRYRPLVSVIIPVHNESLVIEQCIKSIFKSSYRKIELIVVDDASKDNTRHIVRRVMRELPARNIRLVAKRKNGGRGAALNAGIRAATGEVIMALDADCVPEKYAIRNMVRHFSDKKVMAAASNIRILQDGTALGLLQEFEYLISFRSKKFNTITNSEYIIGGAGATYRRTVFDELKQFDDTMKTEDIELSFRMLSHFGNKDWGFIYASDAVVYTEAVPTYKGLLRQRFRWKFGSMQALYAHKKIIASTSKKYTRFLTHVRLPLLFWFEFMLLLEPIYFIYFTYLAIRFDNPALFVSACMTFTAIVMLSIWADEHLSLRTRVRMSLYAPMMYVAYFAMTLVQVIAAFRCVWNIRGITGSKRISGAYIPTERSGIANAGVSS